MRKSAKMFNIVLAFMNDNINAVIAVIVGLSYCFSKIFFLLLPFISSLLTPSPSSICCLVSSCHSTAIIPVGGLVICIYSYPTVPSAQSTTALKCQS